jgi:hypothetical protein
VERADHLSRPAARSHTRRIGRRCGISAAVTQAGVS